MFFKKAEKGQGLVEYAAIFALVVIMVIVLVSLFGHSVNGMYTNIIHAI